MRILREAPYYDDYDPSKEFTQILARPGFVAQAREFTQQGTMMRDFVGRLGDAIFKDGNIINGIQLTISEDKRSAKISTGELYLQGLVRRVLEPVLLNITGVGPEVIGVRVNSEIITESDDHSLRDPAQSYENYNREGAHRLKESLVWSVNNSDSTVIFNLKDGELVKAPVDNSADWFNDILARRTFDESGNYKVSGLSIQERNEIVNDKVLVSLTEGKAYIQGYEVIKPSVSTISLDYSRSKRLVKGEPKTYIKSQNLYKINNTPFADLVAVRSTVEHTQTLVRGSDLGGTDYLSKTPVESIKKIHQSSTGTTYQLGKDFQLVENGISWSLNGKEPSIGTEYTVTYHYIKDMKIGTDVKFVKSDKNQYIKILDGDKPVENSQFYIDYNFYLARTDLICLDKDGNITVLQGVPDIMRLVQSPINQDPYLLVLGSVTLLPASEKVIINNIFTNRLTQNELYSMLRRIQDMEYNQAISDLDKEAIEGEQATQLKGILTDGFVGFSKCDLSSSKFNSSIDIENNFLTLPFDQTVVPMEVASDSISTRVGSYNKRISTAVFTDIVALSQLKATGSMKVNPYSAFDILSVVDINPKVDNWVDTETITINKSTTKTNTVYKTNKKDGGAIDKWDRVNTGWREAQKRGGNWRDYEGEVISEETQSQSSTSTKINKSGSSTTSSSETILDEVLTYMRPIKINFSGSNFSGSDEVSVWFNNKKVKPTPDSGYSSGVGPDTVKVKPDGTVKGHFTIPKNTPSGVVTVELKGSKSSAETTFRSEGRKKVMKNTVLTTHYKTKTIITSITNTRVITKRYDPVAQSFELPYDCFVNKVGLYFEEKDSRKPVIIQIRPMDNGFPESVILAESIIYPKDVNTSTNGSAETLVTLDQPVYCKTGTQYAVCVITDSDKYKVYTASVGSRELGTGDYVTSQPYTQGILFSSSNGATWTTHQDMDLKFKIYRSKFTNSGNILYKDIELNGHTRFLIAVDYLDYNNAGLKWYYKTSDSTSVPWIPVLPYTEVGLNPLSHKRLYLKAEVHYKSKLAPLVANDATNLILIKDTTPGTYLSRTVFLSEKYTNVKIIADMHLPSGSNYELYINCEANNPDSWIKIPNSPTNTTPLNLNKGEEVSRYEWNYQLSSASGHPNITSGAKSYRLKLVLSADNISKRPRVMKLMNILKY